MLNASDLSCMRLTAGEAMPGTAIISRTSQTSDGLGGVTDAWVAVGTVSARVSTTGMGMDSIVGEGVLNVAPWVATLPVGTDITERDRITYQGATYEVVGTDAPRSYATCVRASLRRVR